jgi:peroxiredoxin family protein
MADKLSMTVMTGSVDRLIGMAILAGGAVAMDMEVEIFLQLWGAYAFKKDVIKENMNLSEFKEKGEQVVKRMKELNLPMWFDILKQAKDSGAVKIYACSTACTLWDVKKEDLEMVDDILGAGEWLLKSKDAAITLFI